ncbi:MAG: DUF4230 domain-containing protein [Tissierellia bacterium]|nr:DUF4230 domain-containing protein [Tissierellia bacterium]
MDKKVNINLLLRLLILVSVIAIVFALYFGFKLKNETNIHSENIEKEIQKIASLSTAKFNYVNVAEFSDVMKIKELKLPFTTKRFIVKYKGEILAGLDASKITVDNLDEKTVKISLPRVSIIQNNILEEEVYFFDERDTVFNPLKYDDLYSLLIGEKKKMEDEAIKSGLLVEAETNLKDLLTTFLKALGYEEIKIVFE